MDRSYQSGAAGTPPDAPVNPSKGYPSAGNPASGTPATKPGAYWYHMVTEEIRKVITDAGMTPDASDLTQMSSAIQMLIKNYALPPGSVIHIAQKTAPSGYLKANGAAVSRTAYAALFAVIGTTFGTGDGSTTFNLPDLRGEFLRGFDDGRGVDTGRSFGASQSDELRSHRHTWSQHLDRSSGAMGNAVYGDEPSYGTTTLQSNFTGGNETRPRNVALLACIKY